MRKISILLSVFAMFLVAGQAGAQGNAGGNGTKSSIDVSVACHGVDENDPTKGDFTVTVIDETYRPGGDDDAGEPNVAPFAFTCYRQDKPEGGRGRPMEVDFDGGRLNPPTDTSGNTDWELVDGDGDGFDDTRLFKVDGYCTLPVPPPQEWKVMAEIKAEEVTPQPLKRDVMDTCADQL